MKIDPKDLRLEVVDLAKIQPYPRNPRWRSLRSVSRIENSMAEYGWAAPMIVDEDYEIIAGHGRYKAAKKAGLAKVPVLVTPMTKSDARDYRVVDNRVAEESTWHDDKLREEINELASEGGDVEMLFLSRQKLDGLDFSSEMEDLMGGSGADDAMEPETRSQNASPVAFVFLPEQWEVVWDAITKYRKGKGRGFSDAWAIMGIARQWSENNVTA